MFNCVQKLSLLLTQIVFSRNFVPLLYESLNVLFHLCPRCALDPVFKRGCFIFSWLKSEVLHCNTWRNNERIVKFSHIFCGSGENNNEILFKYSRFHALCKPMILRKITLTDSKSCWSKFFVIQESIVKKTAAVDDRSIEAEKSALYKCVVTIIPIWNPIS